VNENSFLAAPCQDNTPFRNLINQGGEQNEKRERLDGSYGESRGAEEDK
jgi:hypothetical protein